MSSQKKQRLIAPIVPRGLPVDLWYSIFQFLDLQNHLRCKSICKSMYTIGSHRRSWNPDFNLIFFLGIHSYVQLGKRLLFHAADIPHMMRSFCTIFPQTLDICMFSSQPRILSVSHICTQLALDQLEHLKLKILGAQHHVALHAFQKCTKLKSIHLILDAPLDLAVLPWLSPFQNNIQKISIIYSYPGRFMEMSVFPFFINVPYPSSKHCISTCTLVQTTTTLAYCWNISTLTDLSLVDCIIYSREAQLIRQISNLQRLYIDNVDTVGLILKCSSTPVFTKLHYLELAHLSY